MSISWEQPSLLAKPKFWITTPGFLRMVSYGVISLDQQEQW
jgi:hypothetical protein